MITVVEFRAKQATGSRYMPTDRLYANYFFIKIELDWLIGAFQKMGEISENRVLQIWLIFDVEIWVEFQKFVTFRVLQSLQINSDEKLIGV